MIRRKYTVKIVWLGLPIGIALMVFWIICRPAFAGDPGNIETIAPIPEISVNQVYLEHQKALLDGLIKSGVIDAIYNDHFVIDDHYCAFSSSTRFLDAYHGAFVSKSSFHVKMVVEYTLGDHQIAAIWPQQKTESQGQ